MKTIHLARPLAGLVLALGLALWGAHGASAQALNWTNATTVTINSENYTIAAGSAATSMTVGATTLTVTVPSGSTFTLQALTSQTSNGFRHLLNNDQVISQQCSSTMNQLAVTGPVSVVITPDSTTSCVVSNAPSGGGGGATGGPFTDTTPPTNTSVSINSGAATTNTTAATLTLAATGASDMMIANDPNFTGGVWVPFITSKAWTLTAGDGVKNVYAKFRDAAANVSAAVSDSITLSATGATPTEPATTPTPTYQLMRATGDPKVYVIQDGKKTWVKTAQEFNAAGYDWNAVQVIEPSALAAYPDTEAAAPSPAPTPTGYQLMRASGDPKVYVIKDGQKTWITSAAAFNAAGYKWSDIQTVSPTTLNSYPDAAPTTIAKPATGKFKPMAFGTRSEMARSLQQFLKDLGGDIYPNGLVTGYFGPATRAAVQRFQVKYGISGPGKAGYGNFGPATSAQANALLGY